MTDRIRLLLFAAGAAGTAAVFTAGVAGLPAFGGAWHPYADRAVAQAVRQGTSNAVASVTFDQGSGRNTPERDHGLTVDR